MALATRGYTGVYNTQITTEETYDMLAQIVKTKLQTPFEMVHTFWLLEDVSRAFTHQLVRYRVGTSVVQESMRFFGTHGAYRVLSTVPGNINPGRDARKAYRKAAIIAIDTYHNLVEKGIPDQDARGVLPTNILTRLWFSCSLRTLQNILPQRLCCQAQPGEWQLIVREMRRQIGIRMGMDISDLLRAPYELGIPCGYRASFDRPCEWQEEN
jgi:thymidylate synthase (FAD)